MSQIENLKILAYSENSNRKSYPLHLVLIFSWKETLGIFHFFQSSVRMIQKFHSIKNLSWLINLVSDICPKSTFFLFLYNLIFLIFRFSWIDKNVLRLGSVNSIGNNLNELRAVHQDFPNQNRNWRNISLNSGTAIRFL